MGKDEKGMRGRMGEESIQSNRDERRNNN